MDIREVYSFVEGDLSAVQLLAQKTLGSDVSLLNTINETVFASSGKCLRPVICLLAAKAVSGFSNDDTVAFAAVSEMIHNATLLHDDVADKSPLRRGKPTVFSLFGPAAAVLMGDYWLVKAMELILGTPKSTNEVLSLFASTLSRLSEGEILQMQKSESLDTTESDYLRIIHCKTASLFEAAAVSGAMSVDAGFEQKQAMKLYAEYLGYAFQIKDDIFDYTPGIDVGKVVGVDIREHKITLPLLCALKSAAKGDETRVIKAIKEEKYDEVFAFVTSQGGVVAAKEVLNGYAQKAKTALAPLERSFARECLEFLADYTASREI